MNFDIISDLDGKYIVKIWNKQSFAFWGKKVGFWTIQVAPFGISCFSQKLEIVM